MSKFRAKARAIELLGKGQIADLPTAISELWKNGYDAYGDRFGCELFLEGYKNLESPFFTLWDDGVGMSEDDIINKWLVLGTDSKIRGDENLTKEERLNKPIRIKMGEKGIGRLSVSYLGSQMLLLTKQIDSDCIAVFLDWDILQNYNLYLDDFNIPIHSIKKKDDIDQVFTNLKFEFLKNLQNNDADWSEHEKLKNSISKSVKSLSLPHFFTEDVIKDFLRKDSHGTKFIIFDPNEQLLELQMADKKEFRKDSTLNHIRASLSGIYNAFEYSPEDAPFETSFYLMLPNGRYDLISKENFFEPLDFGIGDFLFNIKIDTEGYFHGKIKIYNQHVNYKRKISNNRAYTSYGPFDLKLGYLPGRREESQNTNEQYTVLDKKLENYGGLYIYRDNFRVLPYGLPEYDFLGFEERRSLRAGEYFFSHRRMFGYIKISRKDNPNLKDKAGREGFIRNQAYRDFQQDLITFFTDVAKTYLKISAENESPTLREIQLEQIKLANRAKKLEYEKDKTERKEFAKKLKEYKEKLEIIKQDFSNLYKKLKRFSEETTILYDEIERTLSKYEVIKNDFRGLKVLKPKRFELTKLQENNYHYYLEDYDEIQNSVVSKCNLLVEEIQKKLTGEELKKDFKKKYESYKQTLNKIFDDYKIKFSNASAALMDKLNQENWKLDKEFIERAQGLIPYGDVSKTEIKNNLKILQEVFESLESEVIQKYGSFVVHLEKIDFDIDEDLLVGYYKNQYKEIENKVEAMEELAQLGMAIEIIDHEFNVLYAQMRESVNYFKKYSEENQQSHSRYLQLKNSFDTLEGNHKLLVPLYRTTRRARTNITGESVKDYITTFFNKQFREKDIKFYTSKRFDNYEFYTYESIIKPIFINLISNAIYWITPSQQREIFIDYTDEKILIMNSGEKIEPAYLEEIFSLFFTRKPSGRGIGLYLARNNLRTIGYNIYATNEKKYNKFNGACFVIEKIKEH